MWTAVPDQTIQRRGQGGAQAFVSVTYTNSEGGDPITMTHEVDPTDPLTSLRRIVHRTIQGLEAANAVTPGTPIDPLAPPPITPLEQALQDYQKAVQRLDRLNRLQAIMGWLDTSQIGASGVTVLQAKNALRAEVTADMTNAARITMALDNLPG